MRPFRTNFFFWNGAAALFFSSCVTDPHSHNTMQVFVDLQQGFKYKLSGGNWQHCRLLVLRENVIHQLDTNGSMQLLIYLDAGSTLARQLKAIYLQDADAATPDISLLALLDPGELQRAVLDQDPPLLWQVMNQIFNLLTGTQPAPTIDVRTEKAKEIIASGPAALLSIAQLANMVCLSESRLRALFKKQTGVSIYRYLLWARLRCGISLLMAGKPLWEAALEAGFSDSSHFHKMLVQMFGVAPGAFLKNNQRMQLVTCTETPLHFETRVFDSKAQQERLYLSRMN